MTTLRITYDKDVEVKRVTKVIEQGWTVGMAVSKLSLLSNDKRLVLVNLK